MPADETPVLQLEIERRPEANIVHCTGKVVIDSWAMFTVAVRALIPEGKAILVDLANVSLVDSVGIGTFVSVWASARKGGCELKFINLNEKIHDLFEITRLHGLFGGDVAGA
ncbi:MAG TPA: STAS domain-containing protein [Candidatus Limnocylindrales bacterium]|nr:STAS domain-containing protein [Candidatus Limnocylindrales bacterium]